MRRFLVGLLAGSVLIAAGVATRAAVHARRATRRGVPLPSGSGSPQHAPVIRPAEGGMPQH